VRVVVIFTLVVVLFGGFNWLTARQLVRIHPRRKRIVIALLVAGNAMWLFLPWLRARGDAMRLIRATLGPPWFAWLCFAIVYSIVIFAIFVAWLPFARRVDFVRFARWPSRLFLWTTLVALVAGVYGALVPLRVEHVPIAIDALPPEAEGMRIAVIGDLHVGLFSRPSRLRTIFETARGERPDLVCLAGDLVDDDPFFAPKLLAGVNALGPTVPVLGVLGNHEMYGDPVEMIERLRGSRVRLLVNEGVAMRGLWLAGLSDYAATSPALRPNIDAALAHRGNLLPIVLAHQPKAFADARPRAIPLTLCAHSHGGQCGVRPLHWTLAGVFIPYDMGLYRRGASQLYVHTGAGYWLLPWRLGITPEIVLIELRRPRRASRSGASAVKFRAHRSE
jgi:predicted MPP superfamily phosphohydrolase